MKIVFWSSVHGQTGITSNVLAISTLSTLIYGHMNFITESHFNKNTLRQALLGRKSFDQANRSYEISQMDDIGVDALIHFIKSAPLNEEIIRNCTISMLDRHYEYIPGTFITSRELYDVEMIDALPYVLQVLDKYSDNIFIDTNSGDDMITKKILQIADVIVVNLSQNINIVDEYFEQYSFDKSKVFYIFGKYNKDSKYNINNLLRGRREFHVKNTGFIPDNVEFQDSLSDGNVLEFLQNNMECKKEDSNYYFMKSCKRTTEKLMKFIAVHKV